MSNQLFEALINKAGQDDVRKKLENHHEAVEMKYVANYSQVHQVYRRDYTLNNRLI
jgi:hypothetical protein